MPRIKESIEIYLRKKGFNTTDKLNYDKFFEFEFNLDFKNPALSEYYTDLIDLFLHDISRSNKGKDLVDFP